jgi:pimeloyl-ACP methyl ester carboxylesterase
MPGYPHLAWLRGYSQRGPGPLTNTQTALYRMTDLLNKGFVHPDAGRGLLLECGLVDLVWEITWAEDYETPDDDLQERIGNVDGYTIFIHGWTGNHTVWEEMPGMVVLGNHRLVSITVDHNGFGESVFVDSSPSLESCNPPTAMKSIEKWIDLLKIRRQPGDTNLRVINFVGHSMGGAMLFYLNPMNWRIGEETRLALSPALLLNDTLHKAFFTALGVGIGLVDRLRFLTPVERLIEPRMVDAVCEGGSDFIKQAHAQQYSATPRGTTAATFGAMGLLNNWEIPRKWDLFRVMLGHKDVLVGLLPMMDMLSEMEFPAANVRVVAGSHYMFSVGRQTALQHSQNRDLVVQDILDLHRRALDQQKTGKLVGGRAGFG